MAVYFFYGDEDYNIEQAIENLKKEIKFNAKNNFLNKIHEK